MANQNVGGGAAGAGAAGSGAGAIPGILGLLHLISGVGANLGGPGSLAEEVGRGTQNAIAAQNFRKQQMAFLQRLLSGSGDSMTVDKSGIKLQIDPNGQSFGVPDFGGGNSGAGTPVSVTDGGQGSTNAPVVGSSGASRANTQLAMLPFSSSPLVDPGLAGLTPQDLTRALGGAISVANLQRQRAGDVASAEEAKARRGILQQQADTAGENARTSRINSVRQLINSGPKPTELQKNYAALVENGYEGSFFDFFMTKNATGTKKDYDVYVKQEKSEGRIPVSFADFKIVTSPDEYRRYVADEHAKGTPESDILGRLDWAKQVGAARATKINISPEERAAGTARGKDKEFFSSARFPIEVEKQVIAENPSLNLKEAESDRKRAVILEMDTRIKESPRFHNPIRFVRDGIYGWYDDNGNGKLIRPIKR